MGMFRRAVTALGVVGLLAAAGCGGGGGSDAGDPPGLGSGIKKPSLKPLESSAAPVEGDFDECGLVEPADLAAVIGIDALHITSREVVPDAEGGRLARCSYFTEDVPGISGMSLHVVAGTDREAFFKPFQEFENAESVDNYGDHAEIAGYGAGSVHFVEFRAIEGSTGVAIQYTYNDSPGGMPDLSGTDNINNLLGGALRSMLENVPDEVAIGDGTPEGPCADIDLAQASQVLGGALTASRSVLGSEGAASCQFGGEDTGLGVVVISDPARVQSMGAKADEVNTPDIGDGARVQIQANGEGQGPLGATVNVGDRVVLITGIYGQSAGTVTEPRHEDTELVRTIVDAVA